MPQEAICGRSWPPKSTVGTISNCNRSPALSAKIPPFYPGKAPPPPVPRGCLAQVVNPALHRVVLDLFCSCSLNLPSCSVYFYCPRSEPTASSGPFQRIVQRMDRLVGSARVIYISTTQMLERDPHADLHRASERQPRVCVISRRPVTRAGVVPVSEHSECSNFSATFFCFLSPLSRICSRPVPPRLLAVADQTPKFLLFWAPEATSSAISHFRATEASTSLAN